MKYLLFISFLGASLSYAGCGLKGSLEERVESCKTDYVDSKTKDHWNLVSWYENPRTYTIFRVWHSKARKELWARVPFVKQELARKVCKVDGLHSFVFGGIKGKWEIATFKDYKSLTETGEFWYPLSGDNSWHWTDVDLVAFLPWKGEVEKLRVPMSNDTFCVMRGISLGQ